MQRCRVAVTQVDVRHLDVDHNYVLGPDGAQLARSAPGTETAWTAVDLDPEALVRARENPWFALRKRRPETYDELVARR